MLVLSVDLTGDEGSVVGDGNGADLGLVGCWGCGVVGIVCSVVEEEEQRYRNSGGSEYSVGNVNCSAACAA